MRFYYVFTIIMQDAEVVDSSSKGLSNCICSIDTVTVPGWVYEPIQSVDYIILADAAFVTNFNYPQIELPFLITNHYSHKRQIIEFTFGKIKREYKRGSTSD